MELSDALNQLLARKDLSQADMQSLMTQLMSGQANDAQIGALLIALRMKGETIDEITAAAKVMRQLSTKVELEGMAHLVDTCGTGGDGANIFNVSTATAFVAAAAGAKVAKHGNRSVSSKSGSADLLETAGVNLNLTANQVAACVEQVGVGFMFAPAHHGAMKHVIGARKALGVRTIFNLLGPLTNPANAPYQVLGVYDAALLLPFAQVLQKLGSKHVMVVHAEDGLDEISVSSLTQVAELKDGEITQWTLNPQDYDLDHPSLQELVVQSSVESLNLIRAALHNSDGAARDIICLNAGAALYVSGLADDYAAGVMLARQTIAQGLASKKFDEFIQFTQAI
ncbi:anthranilate phosphoribosyltransferase [Thiomicrospira microaerophila]|uniref:anthranilate phosphoribosyltransferase n=1 Tax=Thiomicrospira microaerophila TaxID=406020 RepID=UPI002010166C|nr:anthranilate phosphoribosyltransferase [Thiomicrospira microaerophila]UQB42029.1 anthranilate phosphoribosyltransferase [Thiomicrospira microaerophila]